MSFVTNHRVDDRIVNNFYEKQTTEGGAANFTSEAPGQRVLLGRDAAVETLSADNKAVSLTFTLPFSFLLKQNQLELFWEQTDAGLTGPSTEVATRGMVRLLDRDTFEQSPTFDETVDVYYEEVDSTTVTIYNAQNLAPNLYAHGTNGELVLDAGGDPQGSTFGGNNRFLFSVPFTSLPADLRERVTVKNQGDNIALEMLGAGDGILMTSRQGKRFLIQIDEGGNLSRKEL